METIKTYKDIEYVVFLNDRDGLIRNYCAYVKLPKGHPFIDILKKRVKVPGLGSIKSWYRRSYDKVPIECHFGLTFGELIKKSDGYPQGFTPGWWVGWDYAHWCDDVYTDKMRDLMGHDPASGLGAKKWTEEEVEQEVYQVIEQVLNYEKDKA